MNTPLKKSITAKDLSDDLNNSFMKDLISLSPSEPHKYFNAEDHDLSQYDFHVVTLSTGKDSLAVLADILMKGVEPSKIILLHHLVDGAHEEDVFFDWDYVSSYYKEIAKRLGLRYAYAYLDGGIREEITKTDQISNNIVVVKPNGDVKRFGRPLAKPNTRNHFPQLSGSLATRWCSSMLKIEPSNKFMRSMDLEFLGKKVAFYTGERRLESSVRSHFSQLELHSVDTVRASKKPRINRYVDHYRPVLNKTEAEIWSMLENFRFTTNQGEELQGILPPPAYAILGRSSCAMCIFNSDRAFSTLYSLKPERIEAVAEYEDQFGITIARPKKGKAGLNVLQRAKLAEPLPFTDKEAVIQCFEKDFVLPIFTSDSDKKWTLPFGAFSTESCGAL